MKSSFRKLVATFGALVLSVVCAPQSWAGCAPGLARPTHSSWLVQPGGPTLFDAALEEDENSRQPSIVGFWHFKLSIGGKVIDAGNQQWHSDGTELLNSGLRPPIIGDYCMGVWQEVEGDRHYRLNHRGLGWNDSGTAFQEIDVFLFNIYLSRDGKSYSGTFTLTAYNESGDPLGPAARGTVTARRITVNDVMPGPLM